MEHKGNEGYVIVSRGNPMIIQVQFGFNQFYSFREQLFVHFPIGHYRFLINTSKEHFAEDYPRNISVKFDFK